MVGGGWERGGVYVGMGGGGREEGGGGGALRRGGEESGRGVDRVFY